MKEIKYKGRVDEDGVWLDPVNCPYCDSPNTEGTDNPDSWGCAPLRCLNCRKDFMAIQENG